MNTITPDQKNAWRTYLRTTWRLTEIIDHELKTRCSISLADYSIILQLSQAEQPGLRPHELAQRVVFSPSRLTHALSRLDKRGLIKRTACHIDGRGSYIMLTTAGAERFHATQDIYEQTVQGLIIDSIQEDEIHILHDIFTKVDQRLNKRDKAKNTPTGE